MVIIKILLPLRAVHCCINLKQMRAKAMLSKAELARKARVSVLTITRIEQGEGCRMDTKKRIIQALGYKIKDKIFPD